MSEGAGTTTVTHAAMSARDVASFGLSLVWRYPRASAPPVSLRWDGARELVIGRDVGCDVQLEGSDVSRRHAALRGPADAATLIADLGSHNGVRVDGRKVAAEAPLGPGSVVRLGGWVGVVTAAVGDVVEILPGFWGGALLGETLAPVRRVAPSDLPVVIEGETGTGKEVVAGALHRWSGRTGPFVAVNCAALPEALAEGELFGYRRGAFTGAERANPGLIRGAEGGTLLLDEVSDLPLALQAKLLRVLEQREVHPLGEPRPVPINVRVVVAGQQPLSELVRAGRFRSDLQARLDGLTVRLPPLRERREDVLPLFSRLLESLGQGRAPAFEADVAERLCVHDWPFNVRELVFLVRRVLALHGGETTLRAQHLPARVGEPAAGQTSSAPVVVAAEPVALPALMVALRTSGGNVARAAAMLGISRQRAYRLMEGQAVDLESLREPEDKP
jgi:hypothetical protein